MANKESSLKSSKAQAQTLSAKRSVPPAADAIRAVAIPGENLAGLVELTDAEFQAIRETMLVLSALALFSSHAEGDVGITAEEVNAIVTNAWLPLMDVVDAVNARAALVRQAVATP